jgi:hypothetical protein
MSVFEAARPHRDEHRARDAAPVARRLRVYLTRMRLDRRIAAGDLADSDAALALRRRQLVASSTRRTVAQRLKGIVEYVDRRGSRPSFSTVVIEPAAVADGRLPILRLAARLEDQAPVSARGVVLAQELLTDASSPFFNPHSHASVAEAVLDVEEALEDAARQRR